MAKKVVKILSIDGGGIRGIIPATILVELERLTNKRIAESFDIIAGTSTGGILGSVLCSNRKYTAKDALDMYVKQGSDIFSRNLCEKIFSFTTLSEAKYSYSGLDSVLKTKFGKETIDQVQTKLLVTSFDIANMEPYFFKSWKQDCVGLPLKMICRATSAAPTYFEPLHSFIQGKERTLIDGGIFINNPAMSAYTEALRIYDKEDVEFLVVSIGTGQLSKTIEYSKAKNWGKLEWIVPLLDCMFDGVSDAVDYQMKMILGSNYIRMQITDLTDDMQEMDNVSEENIKALKDVAKKYVNSNKDWLQEIAFKL